MLLGTDGHLIRAGDAADLPLRPEVSVDWTQVRDFKWEFDLKGTEDPDGTIQGWRIDWDDGSPDSVGLGSPPLTISHSFPDTGSEYILYAVQIQVTDSVCRTSIPFHVPIIVGKNPLLAAGPRGNSPFVFALLVPSTFPWRKRRINDDDDVVDDDLTGDDLSSDDLLADDRRLVGLEEPCALELSQGRVGLCNRPFDFEKDLE